VRIVRTKDLKTWQRLPDLRSKSPAAAQRGAAPNFVDGKYASIPSSDDFIQRAKARIGWTLASIDNAVVDERNNRR